MTNPTPPFPKKKATKHKQKNKKHTKLLNQIHKVSYIYPSQNSFMATVQSTMLISALTAVCTSSFYQTREQIQNTR
ncbi:unnamed protein product, partial [Vitis vinifera]|uniref:Uncharacterized protein n=1 Tax=Vitis vinifera TaxID=29760 RepID=D7TI16_VITVI